MARRKVCLGLALAMGMVWLSGAQARTALDTAVGSAATSEVAEVLARLAPAGSSGQPFVGRTEQSSLVAFTAAGAEGATPPAISAAEWRQFYYEIRNAPLFARDWPNALDLRHKFSRDDRDGTISVAVLDVAYWRLRDGDRGAGERSDEAAETVGLDAQDVISARLFAAAALTDHTHQGERVTFRFAAAHFFSDRGAPLPRLEVDFDDGQGPRSVSFDEAITVSYSSRGRKVVDLRTVYATGEESRARFHLDVKRLVTPEPDATWTVTADIPYAGGYGSGLAYVYLAEGHESLTKPILVIEGFDIVNTTNWPELYELVSAEGLLETLRGDGFDFVALNFDDSNDYIQRHAYLNVALIQRILTELPPGGELVVVGASMGGLVGRYSLAYMEENALEHGVRTFISFDAPQRGANIPLGLQYWVDFFAAESEDAAYLRDALNQPSPRQMLVYHYAASPPGGAASHPLRTLMENELTALGGYPTIPRNVAVANGSGAQHDQGYAAGAQVVRWEYSSFLVDITGNVWAVPDQSAHIIFDGLIDRIWPLPDDERSVVVANTLPYDTAPGGWRPTMAQLDTLSVPYGDLIALQGNHSFIPTISALDFATDDLFYDIAGDDDILSQTPFDAVYFPTENQEHVLITPENVQWLADEVRGAATAVPEETIPASVGLAKLEAHPNPFNPRTTVTFALDRPGEVEIAVYDPAGRRIDVLVAGRYATGKHTVAWDGRDAGGRALPSGVFFLRAEVGDEVWTRKLALVR